MSQLSLSHLSWNSLTLNLIAYFYYPLDICMWYLLERCQINLSIIIGLEIEDNQIQSIKESKNSFFPSTKPTHSQSRRNFVESQFFFELKKIIIICRLFLLLPKLHNFSPETRKSFKRYTITTIFIPFIKHTHPQLTRSIQYTLKVQLTLYQRWDALQVRLRDLK